MPPDSPQDDLFAALNQRFANQGLLEFFPDGLIVGEELPGADFPYAVLDPGADAVQASTNTGEYVGGPITVSVYDKTFDAVKRWALTVRRALRWAPLPLNAAGGVRTLHCKPGGVRFSKEETFFKAVIDFDLLTGEGVQRNPAPGQQA